MLSCVFIYFFRGEHTKNFQLQNRSCVSWKTNKQNSIETLKFNPFDLESLLLDDNNDPDKIFLMNLSFQIQIAVQPKKPC